MVITGTDVTPFVFNTSPDYTTNTKLALEWFVTEDGNYHAVDWSSVGDVYEAEISTYGTQTYINNILTQIDNNRCNYILELQTFAEDEKIFGQDIDYTIISGVVTDLKVREATSFKVFKLTMNLRALSPTFDSFSNFDWSTPGCIQFDHRTDRKYNINTFDSYSSNLYIYDYHSDSGLAEFKINMKNDDLSSLRQFRRITRGTTFTLPVNSLGITYPFGPVSGAGPHTVKLLSLNEERISPFRSIVSVVLSEVI